LAVAKLIEGIAIDAIIVHMTKNRLLFGGQHGFRKGMSIKTNLIPAYESITDLLEHGFPVNMLLLNQTKAFDKISHCYLMIKLSVYQINNDVAQYSFLSGRIQIFTVYDERGDLIYSTPVNIKCGVP
jgi:hypothetical protein